MDPTFARDSIAALGSRAVEPPTQPVTPSQVSPRWHTSCRHRDGSLSVSQVPAVKMQAELFLSFSPLSFLLTTIPSHFSPKFHSILSIIYLICFLHPFPGPLFCVAVFPGQHPLPITVSADLICLKHAYFVRTYVCVCVCVCV